METYNNLSLIHIQMCIRDSVMVQRCLCTKDVKLRDQFRRVSQGTKGGNVIANSRISKFRRKKRDKRKTFDIIALMLNRKSHLNYMDNYVKKILHQKKEAENDFDKADAIKCNTIAESRSSLHPPWVILQGNAQEIEK